MLRKFLISHRSCAVFCIPFSLPAHPIMIITTRCVGLYHQQLSYCIVQYIEKDPNTAIAVLRGLFKYWPWSSASKQVSTCRRGGEKRRREKEDCICMYVYMCMSILIA